MMVHNVLLKSLILMVRLCEGEHVMGEYLAATGWGDRPETTTFKGLFTVREKSQGPLYLREYGVYVRDWVGFDKEHDNGFHSHQWMNSDVCSIAAWASR